MIVTINGVETFVEERGVADAPPLLLMHSIGTSSVIWEDVAADLATDYRVLCPDFRGHGRSAATGGAYTTALLASDMVVLCEALGVDRVHVGGLSLGGLVAQQLAIDRPDLVASLILCDTGLALTPSAMWRDRAAMVGEGGVAALGHAVFDRWVTPSFAATEQGQRLRDTFVNTSADGYAGAAHAIADADFTGASPAIDVPTLIVVGSEDMATPVALARELATAISGAHLHIVEGARHIPSIEMPGEVATEIAIFLRDIPLRRSVA